ncbi:ephrin type-A receptor 4a-like isoform X1 [Apostichopus japonicus]|uniref:ephrin type-A receptor 4a-like isoform X1 n=2 Tax=Stichopus japonicus TaxID=307972 RepID=UPI003AB1AEBF
MLLVPILTFIVILIVLLLVIAKTCERQLHCEARGYRERTRDLQTVNRTETQNGRNGDNIPVTSQQIQRSVLPNLPDEINTSHHEREIETYYSTVTTDTSGSNRLFNDDDICRMLKMKTGTLFTRWMGTILVSLGVTKCVVLTTLSDERVVKHRDVHWDKFVKTSLDLPVTNHVTKVEGIGIVYNQINMITEHLACKTLDNYLTFDPTSQQGSGRSVTSVLDVMKHLSGVLEGMEVIKSYGFLHPCFSTKKILYTRQGQCKLYDFCLAEDAPTICAIKKSVMKSVTLNQFAPEAFYQNEYSAESDVWSTAVVIWEIISAGNKPFPINEEYKPGDVIPLPKTPWPETYMQLRNTLLFDCWSENISLRPSIHHLRNSFKTIFDKLIDNSFYEIPVSSLYTRMISPTDDYVEGKE